jgi:transcriptional regulator with XRE-family HTH domain
MDYQTIERLTKRGNTSAEAIHQRLVATRLAIGIAQKDLAASAGIKYTTFRSQEQSGSPSVAMMTYYLSMYSVDFNFILGGDSSRLPSEMRDLILEKLSELSAK